MLAPPVFDFTTPFCDLSCEELAEVYGPKTAGVADPLISLEEESPVPWFVPDAIGLPPISRGEVSSRDLEEVYEEISSSCRSAQPWLSRSSALNEKSGCNDSPVMYVDPKDRQGSYRAFLQTVTAMREGNPDMGVLLMPMVGKWRTLTAGLSVFGAEIVSFAADTVNPFKPTEMHIALVQGLGIGAVGMAKDAVLVTVDRESGKVTFFGNKDERILRMRSGSTLQAITPDIYRQKRQYYFDPQTKRIESRPLDMKYFGSRGHQLQILDGGILRFATEAEWGDDGLTGLTPFGDPAMLSNLVSIMQFIHARKGRSQIEGAFLTRMSPYPYLYQHILPPPSPELARDIAPIKRHISSDRVVGCGSFEGPLVWSRFERLVSSEACLSRLHEIDAAFAASGYILIDDHSREVIDATPHCLHRLSEGWLNASGHAITLMRYWMREHPERPMTIAERVRISESNPSNGTIAGIRGKGGELVVFKKARLDSNGREMAVEIAGKRSIIDRIMGI